MSNALATTQPTTDLSVQMEFAQAVSSAALLPQAYRGKPADVLLAVGLGSAMGLSPAESLYRIDVIQGTPTASAELIAANVRKAGHKLRVRTDEANMTVTATVIRADDPDYEHTVVRDMAWAQKMGLAGKDNYKKQPLTMLQWRAISGVARLACPEALYGVAYTADEIRDGVPGTPTAPAAPQTFTATPQRATLTAEQVTELEDLMDRKGIAVDDRVSGAAWIAQRQVTSLADLTPDEADTITARLNERADVEAGQLSEGGEG